MSEPIPEVYGRNKLIAFLRKYLLGQAPGHEAPRISVTQIRISEPLVRMGETTTNPLVLGGSQTIARAISFCDITVPADVTLTIESGGILVVKDLSDF